MGDDSLTTKFLKWYRRLMLDNGAYFLMAAPLLLFVTVIAIYPLFQVHEHLRRHYLFWFQFIARAVFLHGFRAEQELIEP